MAEQHKGSDIRPEHGLPIEADGGGTSGIAFADDLAGQVDSWDQGRATLTSETGLQTTQPDFGNLSYEELTAPQFFDPRIGHFVKHLVALEPSADDRSTE